MCKVIMKPVFFQSLQTFGCVCVVLEYFYVRKSVHMFVQSREKDVARLLEEHYHHQIVGLRFHLLGRGVLGRRKLHSL